jgi:hypothetical protein
MSDHVFYYNGKGDAIKEFENIIKHKHIRNFSYSAKCELVQILETMKIENMAHLEINEHDSDEKNNLKFVDCVVLENN